jgi:hypothetical protein
MTLQAKLSVCACPRPNRPAKSRRSGASRERHDPRNICLLGHAMSKGDMRNHVAPIWLLQIQTLQISVAGHLLGP